MKRLFAAALALLTLPALAAELKVLTAGAYKPVLLALAPAFERASGHKLVVDNDTAGGLQKRVAGGEAFDVLVVTPAALTALASQVSGTPRPLAKVGIGVAVKRGAPLPDVASVEAFKRALLAARAIATVDPAAGGTSGIYLWRWFEKEGIAAALRPKAVLVPGGMSAEKLVSGEAEIAVQQMSELLAVPGAQVVGPVPAEMQNWTVYAGVPAAATREPAAAAALLEFLAGPAAREVLAARGMEAP